MAAAQTPQEATAAYRKKVLGFLGDRDPLAVLGTTGDALAGLVRDHAGKRMQTRPIAGKWTPCEVIGHLCDCEWVYGYRTRLILCEENPPMQVMDQDQWVVGQHHNERDPRELVETFRALRPHNLRLWRSLTPRDLARTGRHSERGPESLGELLPMLAGHDLLHLDQLKRLLMAIV